MSVHVPTELLDRLLERYDRPGPRYTSYPTAPTWRADFDGESHRQSLVAAAPRSGAPLSMYVHVPFCKSMCFYCGCSVIVAKQGQKADRYVDQVLREAELARTSIGGGRPVVQHHWGGGTPTFLTEEQLARLFVGLARLFPLAPDAEVSIEVDPRITTLAQLEVLRGLGFNRISMGVQDFDPQVQEAIHRVQSLDETRELVDGARALGFESVNLDLVYGLPWQEVAKFEASIDRVLDMRPDRLACYSYAHVPWLKKHQRVIDEAALPRGRAKMDLYLAALSAFQAAGYQAIGMDHFALESDSLVAALHGGSLHRNFMGYTTCAADDMLSFGITSISEVAGAFAQNKKTLHEWGADLDAGRLPVERGLRRSEDDERRRRVILDLMCRFRLDYADHGGADAFRRRYGPALAELAGMAEDGLVELDGRGIRVTVLGRLFVRNLCMPFDAYLERQRQGSTPVFSRTV